MADNQKGHGQGRVTDPAHDGRLKQNRDDDTRGSHQQSQSDHGSGSGRGAVKDPAHDGRLKQNK